MPEEQPKSPLVPSDDVFSPSGAGAPPPLSEAPKAFSKQKTQIEITPEDLSAPSESGTEAPAVKKERGGRKKAKTEGPSTLTPEPQPEAKKKHAARKTKTSAPPPPQPAPTPAPAAGGAPAATPPKAEPPPKKPEGDAALAEAVHQERSLQEQLIAEFEKVPAAGAAETLKKAIELVSNLRGSLDRQASAVEKTKKFSPARLQHMQLGMLLRTIAEARDQQRALTPADVLEAVRNILNQPTPEAAPPAPAAGAELPTRRGEAAVAVSEGPFLHERGSEGEATLDNPAFNEFLNEVEKRGFLVAPGTPRAEVYTQAFAGRGAVAQGMVEFYRNQLTQEIGAAAGIEDIGKVISKHIEDISVRQPERVLAYSQLLARANECSREIAALEERKARVVSGAETERVLAETNERRKTLELAKASNRFFGGFGRLTGFAAKFKKSEKLKAQAEARAKVTEMGYGRSAWLGGGISSGIGTRDRIGKELGNIRTQVEAAANLEEIKGNLLNAHLRLEGLKKELIIQHAAHNEAAEIVREGIADAMKRMTDPEATSFEGYETADATLAQLERLAEEAGHMDYARHLPSASELRTAYRANAERRAREEIRRAVLETVANPHAPGRQSALLAQFEKWKRTEKVGHHRKTAERKEEREGVRGFVYGELFHLIAEWQGELTEREGKRNPTAESAEDARRLNAEENALRSKIKWVNVLREDIKPPLEPPTTPEGGTTGETAPRGGPEGTLPSDETSPEKPPSGGGPGGPPTKIEIEASAPAPEAVDPLDKEFRSVQTLDDLMQKLPILSAVEFRGRTQTARDVISYLENLDFFFEGGFFATRDPGIKRDYILETYLPELDSIGSEKQPELRAAVRRTVENLPVVKELGITLPPRPDIEVKAENTST